MAWITLKRARRTLEIMIVATAMPNPSTKPVSTVDHSKVNVRCNALISRPEPRIFPARQAMSQPNPMPSSAPSAPAGTA